MTWKVPRRQVYTHNFKSWIKETLWCHLVLKLWPNIIDLGSDPLRSEYVENPQMFLDQYKWLIYRVNGLKNEVYLEDVR
jgi:hypothetical protein